MRIGAAATLALSIICLESSSYAGAFGDLARANNQAYREIRDLGPRAKPSQINEIQNRNFGPPMRALYQEHLSGLERWKAAIKNAMTETQEELKALWGIGKDGKPLPPGAKPPMPEKALPMGRVGAQTDTGEQGGSAGAKEVEKFKKREDAAPNTNSDGIIMER